MATLAIYTPVKGHEVTVEYHAAMFQLARWPGLEFHFGQGPEDLVRCRSRGVRWFLEDTKRDKLLMWDSDVAPNPRVIIRMLEMPFDIVAARYRLKKEPPIYIPPISSDARPDEHGTLPCDYAPLGLLMAKREALQAMVDHYREELEVADIYEGKTVDTVQIFMLLMETVNMDRAMMGAPLGKRVLLSEDYSFCKRARDIGIEIRLMVEPVPHVGSHVYV